MQAYGSVFSKVYNLRWQNFAQQAATCIRSYYETIPGLPHTLLDIACGTGQLALHFLENGYRVTGIDLSDSMLAFAKENAAIYTETGQAHWVQADAAHFSVDGHFGLITSTYDALNHLPDLDALAGCFRSVKKVIEPNGVFIFDLNTLAGLHSGWAGINVVDTEELVLITRGLVDEAHGKAFTNISGCLRAEDGRYDRFSEVMYNTIFRMTDVVELLHQTGFTQITQAGLTTLAQPLDDPEAARRVFFVVQP
jgi:SAM-dependent methyltransferase